MASAIDLERNASNPETLTPPISRSASVRITRRSSWGTPIFPPSARHSLEVVNPSEAEGFEDVDLNAGCGDSILSDGAEPWNTVENIAKLGLTFRADDTDEVAVLKERFSLESQETLPIQLQQPGADKPFNRWIKTLHRKAVQRSESGSGDADPQAPRTTEANFRPHHKKSSSASSLGFVTAMKSASISLASFSVAPRSRRTTAYSSRGIRATERSSNISNGGGRRSEDSSYTARGAHVDEGVVDRSFQRRRVIEEIISTEESYIADVRFLMSVYSTLLASIATISLSLRASITRNLTEIVELHEELLGDLHRVVPHSEYTQNDFSSHHPPPGHRRWHSLDVVTEKKHAATWYQRVPGLAAEPSIAADVAKVFGQKMHRFFAYEEYGAKYELMVKDVASTSRTMPYWDQYQRGLEALAASLASINSQNDQNKKGLTVGDLLIKPVQRVCRYPLLFAELLKQTPVIDCPESHLEIEKVLIRLRETTTAINKATDDPRMKVTIERTWMLQDRVIFPGQLSSTSKSVIRTLGHMHLCGVLHCAWQTKESVEGEYMICLLYRDCLLLASIAKNESTYTIQAAITLNDARIEEVDNGKGLQCHTAPFSWKLVFECDHQLYEIIFSGCSPKEELEWRTRIYERAGSQVPDAYERAVFSLLALPIKSMGTVFGKPGTVARRLSIHRATTIGQRSSLCQVIVKNTSALKEVPTSPASAAIYRSQSLLMTNRIPMLAPPRTERVRLELLLSEVWSKEILPWPGLTSKARSEHLVRTSASSMIRKLSVASITSNFSKRSASQASSLPPMDDEIGTFRSMSFQKSTDSAIQEEIGSPRASANSFKTASVARDENIAAAISQGVEKAQFNSTKDQQNFDVHDRPRVKHREDSSETHVSLKRLATLRVKKSWYQSEGYGNTTPPSAPLRASSSNSLKLKSTIESDSRKDNGLLREAGNENASSQPQTPADQENDQAKQSKWNRATILQKGFSTGHIRSLFR